MKQTVKHIKTDLLNIGYLEYGASDGIPLILLHGFPYDVHAYDKVCRLLLQDNCSSWHIFVPWLRGYGETTFLSDKIMRSGEQAALAYDLLRFMEALDISKTYLAGFDWGGRAACIVSALFPEKVMGLISCGVGYNMHDPCSWQKPLAPETEMKSWYVYYLNTERGKNALIENRNDFCRCLWKTWSPDWHFTEEEFKESASSFRNPDFAEVVVHSYRCRIGETPEDPRYQAIAEVCGEKPVIKVPTMVLLGMSDGVTTPTQTDMEASFFVGYYRRILLPQIGHNVPQEAPEALVDAIQELYRVDSGM